MRVRQYFISHSFLGESVDKGTERAHSMRMKTLGHRKYRHQKAVPVNLTVPPLLHEEMLKIIRQHGFNGPSDYFQARIRLDGGLLLKMQRANGKTEETTDRTRQEAAA